MYKEDLALNNLQWLICHITQPNQINHIDFDTSKDVLTANIKSDVCNLNKTIKMLLMNKAISSPIYNR